MSSESGYVVAVGLFISLAGGWWIGMILLVLASPIGHPLDAGALIVAVAALCGAYGLVGAAGGPLHLFVALSVSGGLMALL